ELAYPGEPPRDVIAHVMELPIKRLVLRHTIHTSRVLEGVLQSRHLERLEELVVTDGDLTEVATIQLRARKDRLAHLRVLDIGGLDRTTANRLTETAVLGRARNAKAAAAARGIARPDKWLVVARDGERLWGEFEGTDHYY